jgi:hypothetical protein
LYAKCATGALLASEAVADGSAIDFTFERNGELTAATCGAMGFHFQSHNSFLNWMKWSSEYSILPERMEKGKNRG